MNNGNKLGHLLNEARMEPSIVTEEEVRNLLQEKGRIKDSYISFIIQQIQGVPFMYKLSLGVAVAAIVGLITTNILTIGQTQETKVASQQEQKHNVKVVKVIKQDTDPVKQNGSEIHKNQNENKQVQVYQYKINQDNVATDESQKQENPKDFQWTSNDHINPVNVKGINYIQMTPEQLTNMGIVTNSDGELKYWDNWGAINSKAVLCTLYVKGGLGIKEQNNPDYDLINNPGFSPRLITDNKGNKRVSVINDDNDKRMKTQYDELKTIDNGDSLKTKMYTSTIINQQYGDSASRHQTMMPNKNIKVRAVDFNNDQELDIDSLLNSEIQTAFSRLDNEQDLDSATYAKVNKVLKQLANKDSLSVLVLKDLLSSANSNIGTIEAHIALKKLLSSDGSINKNSNVTIVQNTNTLNEENGDVNTTKIAYSLFVGDSLNNIKDNQVDNTIREIMITKHDNNIDTNSILETTLASSRNARMFRQFNPNDSSNKMIFTTSSDVIKNLDYQFDDLIKINKLIPVLVSIGKVESDNELIDKENFGFVLWFDPTPEFISALPADVRNKLDKELLTLSTSTDVCNSTAIAGEEPYMEVWRACSGAVENLNVFPNPSNGKINVNFSLTENRNVTISIHDMFGNVVKELSANQSNIPGQFTDEFNIGEFESGMYLISIQTENGEAAVQRIVLVK